MHRVPGPRTNNDAAAGQKTRRGKSLNENREDEKNGESRKSGRREGRRAHDCHAAGGIVGRGSAADFGDAISGGKEKGVCGID